MEERFNRDKNTYSFPNQSIEKALQITGLKTLYEADIVLCEFSSLNGYKEKENLENNGYNLKKFKNIQFITHHICHAANVFLFSNVDLGILILLVLYLKLLL